MSERNQEAKPKSYYRPVPGSRELVTGSRSDSAELLALHRAGPGADGLRPLCPVGGQWLGGARVEEEFVAVPLSIFDRLALVQTPLEQAVYLQLVRLAYGEGRNYCWVGKRELMRRGRLSERRLHVALDGLVQKGQVKPLARRNLGTLYRVLLPAEVLDGRPEPGVRLGERREPAEAAPAGRAPRSRPSVKSAKPDDTAKSVESISKSKDIQDRSTSRPEPAAKTPPPRPAPTKTRAAAAETSQAGADRMRSRPLESPLNDERFSGLGKGVGPVASVGEIASAFFQASGVGPTAEERDAAISEITGLLEDGYRRGEILRAAEWYGKKFKKARKLDRLAYYIHQALEE
jgi:hypothetical protein